MSEIDTLSQIRPFWRAAFCLFYCHSLLRRISEDKVARSIEAPSFWPNVLATGWVVLAVLANVISRVPGTTASIVSAFVPSFHCLVPVQKYVNTVTERSSPALPHNRWSWGQIALLVIGAAIWLLLVLGMFVDNKGEAPEKVAFNASGQRFRNRFVEHNLVSE